MKIEQRINELSAGLDLVRQLVTTYPSTIWDHASIYLRHDGEYCLRVVVHGGLEMREAKLSFAQKTYREANWMEKVLACSSGCYIEFNGTLCGVRVCLFNMREIDTPRPVFRDDPPSLLEMAEMAEHLAMDEHAINVAAKP